jgi:hypothetical protein
MKNIHILPTDKPSRLVIDTIENKLYLQSILHEKTVNVLTQNIYNTSDEKIKEGDWFIDDKYKQPIKYFGEGSLLISSKKIILTDNKDLIKDGVQAIDDEFLEWFVKNPNCESVETKLIEQIPNGITFGMFGNDEPPTEIVYKIIIPQEEPKQEGYICPQTKLQCRDECCVSAEDCHIEAGFGIVSDCEPPKEETIEEASHTAWINYEHVEGNLYSTSFKNGFKDGARWQAERMYSEGEVRDIIFKFSSDFDTKRNIEITLEEQKQWLKNFNNK